MAVVLAVVILVRHLHFVDRVALEVVLASSLLQALVDLVVVLLRVDALHLPLLLKRNLENGSGALLHDVGRSVAHVRRRAVVACGELEGV